MATNLKEREGWEHKIFKNINWQSWEKARKGHGKDGIFGVTGAMRMEKGELYC